jgi:epoxyqueuosine reductase
MRSVQEIREFALRRAGELGFVAAGVAPVRPALHTEALAQWVAQGYHASMQFMARDVRRRCDVRAAWPWARSVLCLAAGYAGRAEDSDVAAAGRAEESPIARYARGRDYHRVLKSRSRKLADELAAQVDGLQTLCCVDTAPLLERELAAAAGLGWIGKNACLIHPQCGSYILLAEIILSVELPADAPRPDGCGDCTRCLEACPNGALVAPYVLDARRCNSWATIENRGELDGERFKLAGQVFGCDLCQRVCPHNQKAAGGMEELAQPHGQVGRADVAMMLTWSAQEWDQATRGSAVRRAGYEGLLRNAAIAAGQCRLPQAAAALARLATHEDDCVAAAARWALARCLRR